MSRRFTFVTIMLTAVVAFLVGAIVAGGTFRSSVTAGAVRGQVSRDPQTRPVSDKPGLGARSSNAPAMASLVNFADVVERLNPAVVNIDTTTRSGDKRRRGRSSAPGSPDPFDGPFDFGTPRDRGLLAIEPGLGR